MSKSNYLTTLSKYYIVLTSCGKTVNFKHTNWTMHHAQLNDCQACKSLLLPISSAMCNSYSGFLNRARQSFAHPSPVKYSGDRKSYANRLYNNNKPHIDWRSSSSSCYPHIPYTAAPPCIPYRKTPAPESDDYLMAAPQSDSWATQTI